MIEKYKNIIILLVITSFILAISLDIFIVRQILSIAVIVFLPGYLFLGIIKNKPDILLSVGLSLALDILFMLGINFLAPVIFEDILPITFSVLFYGFSLYLIGLFSIYLMRQNV